MQTHEDDADIHDFGWFPEISGVAIVIAVAALFFGLAV